MLEEKTLNNQPATPEVVGVIGIVMDVSELKAKEKDLKVQAKEKQQLVANEAAAKEASRLKSQFLANVSVAYPDYIAYTNVLRCPMKFEPPLLESSEWQNFLPTYR